MHFSSFLLVAIFAVSVARCAPIQNNTTFSDNAKQAQELNAKFLNLKATDPCQVDESVCIGGNIAKCNLKDGKFETSTQCPDGQECIALPNLQASGTSLVCTTERNALSLIKAAGVDGGLTGSDNNSTSTSSTSSGTSSSSTTTSSLTSSTGSPSNIPQPPAQNPGNVVTVTVTEFANPRSTTTTATLSPSGSSSIPNIPLAGGLSPTTSTSSVPPSSTPPSVIVLSVAGGGATNPTPTPSPATPSSVPIQLSAVAEEPSPSAPTPAPSPSGPVNIPAGGGGGGYYP